MAGFASNHIHVDEMWRQVLASKRMILQVLNIEDIDRELSRFVNQAIHPAAKLWLKTIPKEHLLNLDGKLELYHRDQNFVRWTSGFQHRYEEMPDHAKLSALRIAEWCRSGLPPLPSDPASIHRPLVLPSGTTDALWRGQPLYLFDPAAAEDKHGIWVTIKLTQEWLNSMPSDVDYAGLSFVDAERETAHFFPKSKAGLL
ncbi:MAG: hypothetical protein ABSE16_17310 [Verrucomicrobiota bacterium]